MLSVSAPVLRFAPSPNGRLHLGHARSALLNARLAARLGGRLLLRMEDIDPQRCNREFEAGIVEDLTWLGVAFEPQVRRQSEHMDAYRAALDRLAGMGLLYRCHCTRGDIARAIAGRADWPRDPDGSPLYPGTCRTRAISDPEAPAALRLDMAAALARLSAPLTWTEYGEGDAPREIAAAPARWGDAVLARRDVATSYHIAVVVDDALQGVTDVVRGADLYAATGLHRLLQVLLGLPASRYHHHALVLDAEGRKLSKSSGSTALAALRAGGATPAQVRAMAGIL